ncbi:MAG: cyclomaltodextrinase C-terminal domain-containing protein, partial [Muribaculaceae bacterium]|nr:cyclomaltodextrinase C-terminal domain-containing protein [Muribaculaceae bacterium]
DLHKRQPQNGLYVYERRLGDRQIVVIMNGNDSPVTTAMDRTAEILPYGTVMRDLIGGDQVTVTGEMTFGLREIMILSNF